MVTSATTMALLKSAGVSLLLLSFLLHVADSYSNDRDCVECKLRRNPIVSKKEQDIYQCMGCCFSKAYPTSPRSLGMMSTPKNITSEAACCVAKSSEIIVNDKTLKNHTACYCSACSHNRI